MAALYHDLPPSAFSPSPTLPKGRPIYSLRHQSKHETPPSLVPAPDLRRNVILFRYSLSTRPSWERIAWHYTLCCPVPQAYRSITTNSHFHFCQRPLAATPATNVLPPQPHPLPSRNKFTDACNVRSFTCEYFIMGKGNAYASSHVGWSFCMLPKML